jgi:lysozyme
MSLIENCLSIVKHEEGFSTKPYYCTEGYPTGGYGKLLGGKGEPLPDLAFNEADESKWLQGRIIELIGSVSNRHQLAWSKCNDAQRAILVSMAYQLGITGLANFRLFLQSLSEADFNSAALHMLDSRWHKQTPKRAQRHAEQIQTGEMLSYYL